MTNRYLIYLNFLCTIELPYSSLCLYLCTVNKSDPKFAEKYRNFGIEAVKQYHADHERIDEQFTEIDAILKSVDHFAAHEREHILTTTLQVRNQQQEIHQLKRTIKKWEKKERKRLQLEKRKEKKVSHSRPPAVLFTRIVDDDKSGLIDIYFLFAVFTTYPKITHTLTTTAREEARQASSHIGKAKEYALEYAS